MRLCTRTESCTIIGCALTNRRNAAKAKGLPELGATAVHGANVVMGFLSWPSGPGPTCSNGASRPRVVNRLRSPVAPRPAVDEHHQIANRPCVGERNDREVAVLRLELLKLARDREKHER